MTLLIAIIVGLAAAMLYGFFYLKGNLSTNARKENRDGAQELTIEQARAQLDLVIATTDKFIVEPGVASAKISPHLSAASRSFFAKYGSLKTQNGSLLLSFSEVRASEYAQGCISIGHSEDWDVAQRPGSDQIFILEGSEQEAETDAKFASVFHFLLDEARGLS